jgi:parallel beta-helix repeat protein
LVPDGSVLTIEPGVEIRFDDLYTIQVNGILIAEGSPGNRIVFTSNKAVPAPGDWRQILFSESDGGSSLNYCDILYAGGGETNTTAINLFTSSPSISNTNVQFTSSRGIYLAQSSPTISNSVFSDNALMGIEVTDSGSDPVIDNCTIENNGDYAISMIADNVKNIQSVTIAGNAKNSIRVEGEAITTALWLNHGVPYVIDGFVTVNDGDTLTIAAGNELRFDDIYTIQVNGTLIAEGTPNNRIVFTSNKAVPAPGDWRQLFFSSSDPGTSLNYCDIYFAGGGGSNTTAINLFSSSPSISNTNVQFTSSRGIYLAQSSPTISNSVFSDNALMGIEVTDSGSDPIIDNCTIENNGNYAISMFADNIKNIQSVTISGNAKNNIRVEGESINSATWLNHGVPYVMAGSVTVNDGETLTIASGNELRFTAQYTLQVNGTLVANGTADNHIVFTSNKSNPAPGDWRQIFFSTSDGGSSLNYCDIFYGGSNTAAVNMSFSSPLISNSTVQHSLQRGIHLSNSSPIIRGSLIADNNGNGVHIVSGSPDLGTLVSPGNNIFRDNGGWEVYNNTADTIYAINNDWVDSDSATIDTLHIFDDDENPSKGIVIFTPWQGATAIEDEPQMEIPVQLLLHQNYPNPFNPSTTIKFQIPNSGFVTLKIYDLTGRDVATLINEQKPAGSYELTFEAGRLASGMYFYRLEAGEFQQIRKMLLVR